MQFLKFLQFHILFVVCACLLSLVVYQSAFQAFSQCKAIHLLVTALEQDEKLCGNKVTENVPNSA